MFLKSWTGGLPRGASSNTYDRRGLWETATPNDSILRAFPLEGFLVCSVFENIRKCDLFIAISYSGDTYESPNDLCATSAAYIESLFHCKTKRNFNFYIHAGGIV